jgi:hypothetical protein
MNEQELTPEQKENEVVMETHLFRCIRFVNKSDPGFSALFGLLTDLIEQGKEYPENIKLLIKGMNASIVHHAIHKHTSEDIQKLKKMSEDRIALSKLEAEKCE